MMNDILVIIPTYNETESIAKLIDSIFTIDENLHILIIDDNSPDGTADIINNMNKKNLFLIKREKKLGLGSAYCCGFKYAIKNSYNTVVQMDADFSHNPLDIPILLKYRKDFDLIIGSRYINGVRIINWPISRLMLSYFANLYSRIITGMPIQDTTAGFKIINTRLLSTLNFEKIKSEGYSFQIEINFLSWANNFKIIEIPIIFTDRTTGTSKISYKIIFEAIYMVPLLRIKKLFNFIK